MAAGLRGTETLTLAALNFHSDSESVSVLTVFSHLDQQQQELHVVFCFVLFQSIQHGGKHSPHGDGKQKTRWKCDCMSYI